MTEPDPDLEARQRDNFNHWKSVVGLPQTFPRLSVLKDYELDASVAFYKGYKHEPKIQEVLDSVTNSRLAVLVNVGHGCTTLSRYVFKHTVEDAVRTRTISVRLSVDQFDPEVTEYASIVFERCREAIVTSLILAPWHRPLRGAVYAGLIGAPGQTAEDLEPHRIRLAALLGLQLHTWDLGEAQPIATDVTCQTIDWEKVSELAPRLAVAPHDLLYDITHRERIELSLQIDLSSTRFKDPETNLYTDEYYEVVGRLSSAVKAVHEQEATDVRAATGGKMVERSMLGIMLFASEDGLETFTAEWDQEFDRLDYPIYGPPDVFAILAYHYPQRVGASGIVRTQAMVAIMADTFVNNAYDADMSLHAIIEKLEQNMLERFDDWANARIRLE